MNGNPAIRRARRRARWFARSLRLTLLREQSGKPSEGSGGSSAGPASATAAGGVAFAIGSDTGGSILGPSVVCGTIGSPTCTGGNGGGPGRCTDRASTPTGGPGPCAEPDATEFDRDPAQRTPAPSQRQATDDVGIPVDAHEHPRAQPPQGCLRLSSPRRTEGDRSRANTMAIAAYAAAAAAECPLGNELPSA